MTAWLLKAQFTTPNHCLVPNQQAAGFCLFFMLVSILQNGILNAVSLSTVLNLLLQKKDHVSHNVNKGLGPEFAHLHRTLKSTDTHVPYINDTYVLSGCKYLSVYSKSFLHYKIPSSI